MYVVLVVSVLQLNENEKCCINNVMSGNVYFDLLLNMLNILFQLFMG